MSLSRADRRPRAARALAALLLALALACGSHGPSGPGDGGACDGAVCGAPATDGGADARGKPKKDAARDGSKPDAGKGTRDAASDGGDGGLGPGALNPTVATNLAYSSAFLYSGDNPVQTGVAAGTIDITRVSVIRGQVSARSSGPSAVNGLAPMAGVAVTVVGHPEYGATTTQSDGWFSMAVNGGGVTVVAFSAPGYLPVQRRTPTTWLEYAITNPVVLTAPEPGTAVTLSSASTSFQVVRGLTHGTASSLTPNEDADGARTATVLIPPGTTASIDGLNDVATTMRATEFTTGSNGLAAMPADLPPTSAYTYAVDLSIDEANGQPVTFSQPVLVYVDNFIGFPVGNGSSTATTVPSGAYDPTVGVWVPSTSGQVVKVLTNAGGTVTLDITGAGKDTPDRAFTPPLVEGERAQIASLYAAGASFWRVAVPHFSDWDFNWGLGPPAGAIAPDNDDPIGDNPDDNPCLGSGSIIECENQILAEEFPLVGTPFGLRYQSERTAGWRQVSAQIPITGDNPLPSIVTGIEVVVETQGRQWTFRSQSLAANQSVTWTWDRTDAYGRIVNGHSDVSVQVGYDYQATSSYKVTEQFGEGGNGTPITGNRALRTLTIWQYSSFAVDQIDASTTFGLGGLSLTAEELYDPFGQTFYGGDGTRRTVDGNHFTVIQTYAGGGTGDATGVAATSVGLSPNHIAMGGDGTLYIAEYQYVRSVDPKTHVITTLGGNGQTEATLTGNPDDNQPATSVPISPYGVAVGSDGAVYVTTNYTNRVRRIDPTTGMITTIAGNGEARETCNAGQPCSDGQAATSVPLAELGGVAVEPWPGGCVYFSEQISEGVSRVRKIQPDGTLATVIDGLSGPDGLTFGPQGSLYVVDQTNNDVVRLTASGEQSVVAGAGRGYAGDGGPATAALLFYPTDVAVDSDGSLYITDTLNFVIRYVDTRGVIRTLTNPNSATLATSAVTDDNGPAGAAVLSGPLGVVRGPDHALYVADSEHGRVRVIKPPLPSFTLADAFIPSQDGSVVYQFYATGQHRFTYDALRGQTLLTPTVDSQGYLSTLTDNAGNVTTIDRSTPGSVVITAPFGQATTLTLDANGYVTSLANPNGETVGFTYETTSGVENGLLATLTDPKGQVHSFAYTAEGLLTEDSNPAGGSRKLARSNATSSGWTVTHTTKMGYSSTYAISTPSTGGWQREVTDPTGAKTDYAQAGDGSRTATIKDVLGNTLETSVVTLGPDPRYQMIAPIPTSTTTTLKPSGLAMASTHTRTVSVGSTFFDLSKQVDVVTANPGSAEETLTTTYKAGTPNNTLEIKTTTGRTITATLDANDRVIGLAVPGIAPETVTYNTTPCSMSGAGEGCGGRVLSVSSTSATGGTRTWTTHYQYAPDTGFASSTVDAVSNTVAWLRDPVGRPLTEQLPTLSGTSDAENELTATWDKNGNLASLAVPSTMSPAPTHGFPLYNGIDQLESYAPPPVTPPLATSNTTYAYNFDGQLTQRQAPETSSYGTVAIGYDTAGRVETIADSVSGVTDSLAYAPSGLLQSLATSDGETIGYGFGVDGPMLMSTTWSGSVAGSVAYTHDSFFRVASRAVNGGTAVDYLYDADGLYAGASGLLTYSVTRDFNGKNGLLTGSTTGTVTDAFGYDSFGELSSYTASVGGNPLYTLNLSAYDADGRITAATETLSGTSHTWGFAYDSHGDLSSVTEDGTTTSYTFDPNGNRLSVNRAPSTYDAQDRLVTSPGASYTYTNNGDLQTKVTSGGTTSYVYDLRGALRSVSLPNGDRVAYVIDGQARRVGRTWTHGGQTVTQGFLYDNPLQVAAELDASGNVVSTFVYGTRLNVPDVMVRGGKTYRIVSDWRGSVRAVVDASAGTVVETIDYDAWGNATVNDTTCAAGAVCAMFQPFGFAGGIFDRETGLVRFGARDYDPSVGRWTQKDRSGLAAGPNVYAYASGDPVDFVDLTGRLSISCGSVFVGGIEGAVNDLAAQAFRAAANSFCDPGGSSTDINWGEVAQAAALGALGGALSGNCFEAGTLVATCANGEQPIETLREGDEVLSRNADTGETACRQVVHTYVHDADDVARLSVSADDGGDQKEESFAVTLGHPFWVDGRGWTPVRELAPGDVLSTAAGEARVVVGGWLAEGGSARVFNLEVEGDHSYFVGHGGVWVHNGCGGPGPVAQGAAGVQRAIQDIEGAGGTVLGEQVSVEAGGVVTRPDLYVELPNGKTAFVEVKTGPSAGLTPNQTAAFPTIESTGGAPFGGRAAAAGLPGSIGPTPVVTVYYPWPLP